MEENQVNTHVICPICGIKRASLGRHLFYIHNLTKEEFLEKYPKYPLVSESLRKKASDNCKKQWEEDFHNKLAVTHSPASKRKRKKNRKKKAVNIEDRFKLSRGIIKN
jgi:hypothetical protein